jgi:transcriptional regulator with XRE-family HTH domain
MRQSSGITKTGLSEIGRRLKAHRIGRGQTADELAEKLGISRAAVYRIESGGLVKIDTLEQVASELRTSLASLLGVSIEYYSSAISYFDRMRQLEEQSEQVVAHFPPISYLLTSERYPAHLKQMLMESLPSDVDDKKKASREIDAVIAILGERKKARAVRRLSVVNFVTIPEIERWLKLGVVGRFDLPDSEIAIRRQAAQAEVENLVSLVEGEPMGIQIALLEDTLPNITFQLFRSKDQTRLGLKPVPAWRRTAEYPAWSCDGHVGPAGCRALRTARREPLAARSQGPRCGQVIARCDCPFRHRAA